MGSGTLVIVYKSVCTPSVTSHSSTITQAEAHPWSTSLRLFTSATDQEPTIMAETQRGAVLEALNTPYKIVDNLPIPEPGEGQVLIKSIATAINPV